VEDLERIGDLAKNIAKRATAIGAVRFTGDVTEGIERLSWLALQQLKGALETYVGRDPERALALRRQDEQLDELHTGIFRDIVSRMTADPSQTVGFVHLLFCAKNIERIGDHATHIAEAAYLIATGTEPHTERRRLDQSSTVTGGDIEASNRRAP
jgi:phosphate transport system protein